MNMRKLVWDLRGLYQDSHPPTLGERGLTRLVLPDFVVDALERELRIAADAPSVNLSGFGYPGSGIRVHGVEILKHSAVMS